MVESAHLLSEVGRNVFEVDSSYESIYDTYVSIPDSKPPYPALQPRWLLLLTHIPAAPAYLRVKVRRRLQQLGAVPVKQGVFALPCGDASVEDFQWLRAEIEAGGGEASICEAGFVAGLTDDDVEELFRSARDVDYRDLLREAQTLREELARGGGRTEGPAGEVMAAAARLREKLEEIREIDFFTAGGRSDVEAALNEIEMSVRQLASGTHGDTREGQTMNEPTSSYQKRTWVTRQGVFVDRMASAWLIRRLIDPGASFRFVAGHEGETAPDEVRFDMYQGEFTHEGDLCTFEVLLRRFGVADPALQAIAEIVHDLDLKESKYSRPETAGIGVVIKGIAAATDDDEERINRAVLLFDQLRLACAADPGRAS